MVESIGFAAAILTTASFLPQVARTWRTRSAHDLSWIWILMFGAGLGLWLAYGLVIGSWSLVAANGVTLALVLSLGWLKLFRSG
ncbi:MAG TPA: SemiSWEET transporter [Micropepsaceae bacterium]|nr:SemiSWEET transporter [Micropepsaceae bacterium]HRK71492.1 SemiSWEET transporter [Micropepsaceae bacterium]